MTDKKLIEKLIHQNKQVIRILASARTSSVMGKSEEIDRALTLMYIDATDYHDMVLDLEDGIDSVTAKKITKKEILKRLTGINIRLQEHFDKLYNILAYHGTAMEFNSLDVINKLLSE